MKVWCPRKIKLLVSKEVIDFIEQGKEYPLCNLGYHTTELENTLVALAELGVVGSMEDEEGFTDWLHVCKDYVSWEPFQEQYILTVGVNTMY